MSESPAQGYRIGRDGAAVQAAFWQARGRLVSNARLACFAILLVVAWLAFGTRSLAAGWLLLPATAFVALVVVHDRVLARATRAAASSASSTTGSPASSTASQAAATRDSATSTRSTPTPATSICSAKAPSTSSSRRPAPRVGATDWRPGSSRARPRTRSASARPPSRSCDLASICAGR